MRCIHATTPIPPLLSPLVACSLRLYSAQCPSNCDRITCAHAQQEGACSLQQHSRVSARQPVKGQQPSQHRCCLGRHNRQQYSISISSGRAQPASCSSRGMMWPPPGMPRGMPWQGRRPPPPAAATAAAMATAAGAPGQAQEGSSTLIRFVSPDARSGCIDMPAWLRIWCCPVLRPRAVEPSIRSTLVTLMPNDIHHVQSSPRRGW